MKKIGLCMIVKDEAHVIERCLDSLKILLDYVLIVDTGSTDDTISIIRNWLIINNLPGEVIEENWKNFAYNRSFALTKLQEIEVDYSIMIDADEVLIFDANFNISDFKNSLSEEIYDITTNMGGFTYTRPTLTSNKRKYRYEGVVHEFLAMDETSTRGKVVGFYNKPIQDSNRNKDPNKFLNDALLLEEALKTETGEWLVSRYTFYLAQCYKDSGKLELALENYLKRSEQGFWNEEVFISLYSAGNLMKILNYDKSIILQTWMNAYEILPYRAESLWAILQYCRTHGLNNQGYIIGKVAKDIIYPENSLFVEGWVYDYGILDEFSILAFWSGHYSESKESCDRLLEENKIPEYYLERVKSNLQFSLDRLGIV